MDSRRREHWSVLSKHEQSKSFELAASKVQPVPLLVASVLQALAKCSSRRVEFRIFLRRSFRGGAPVLREQCPKGFRPADLVCASELTICARDKLRAKAVRVNTAHFFYLHGGSEIVRVLPLLIPFCNFLGSPNFSQPRDVAGPRFSGAWRGPITPFDARDNFRPL